MAIVGEHQFAPINAAATDTTLVAAQAAGVRIRVVALLMVAAGAVVATLQSGTGGTALIGPISLVTGMPILADVAPFGQFQTAAATLLNLHLSAAVQVSGALIWVPVS